MIDLSPWQKRAFVALWLGSLSFTAGHAAAGWFYDKLTRRKP